MSKQKVTPMMKQYYDIKNQYPDAFLFYRVGSFYELYNEDAVKGARILEITLTARNKHSINPVPECGVPFKAVLDYAGLLVEKGYKVAICNQLEDPTQAKGMVKRGVVRLITPGTFIKDDAQSATTNNYITALEYDTNKNLYGFAYAELSTGELKSSELQDNASVLNELMSLQTKEVVVYGKLNDKLVNAIKKVGIMISHQNTIKTQAETSYLTQKLTSSLEKNITARLLTYIHDTQKRNLSHLKIAKPYEPKQYLDMDHSTRYNLDLLKNSHNGKKMGSLLWILDNTKTAMGGRKLKRWLSRPLINKADIIKRQNAVQELLDHYYERHQIQNLLLKVYDLERLVTKVSYGSVNGRDLIQLKESLEQIPKIKYILGQLNPKSLGDIYQNLNPVVDVKNLIQRAIVDEPPISVTEGGVIKDHYNQKLDKYRSAMNNGKQWMADLQAQQRKLTGISNLKVGFNHVFGYYIQVTKSGLNQVPDSYERKQTLTNSERFSTPSLKQHEALIIEAQEHSKTLEQSIFGQVRNEIKKYIRPLQETADAVASLDVLQGFAGLSEKYRWIKPQLTTSHDMKIIDGRHPVVERVLGHQSYVPNNVIMDPNTQVLLITGPNMSGKSTYMRQLALTVIMAQMGCFVPAKSALIPIFDQIFTRIGAADNLVAGQSTFMVEMQESNDALQHATANSLILFDELGRGTATYDGMSLAQAIVEYVHNHIHAKTLLSTHYHGLTTLAKHLPHLKNVHVGATEKNGNLVFLHKVEPGPADKSYGIHVAKLAGLPSVVLKRANHILHSLEAQSNSNDKAMDKSGSSVSNTDYQRALDKNKALETELDKLQANHQKQTKVENQKLEQIKHQEKSLAKQSQQANDESQQMSLFHDKQTKNSSSKASQSNPIDRKITNEINHLDLMSMPPIKVINDVYKWKQQIKKANK